MSTYTYSDLKLLRDKALGHMRLTPEFKDRNIDLNEVWKAAKDSVYSPRAKRQWKSTNGTRNLENKKRNFR